MDKTKLCYHENTHPCDKTLTIYVKNYSVSQNNWLYGTESYDEGKSHGGVLRGDSKTLSSCRWPSLYPVILLFLHYP